MERIEVTVYPNDAKSVEAILQEYDVPYVMFEGKTAGTELFHYRITAPEHVSHDIVEKLARLVNTRQKNLLITNEKIEATVSDYLEKLAEKIRKPRVTTEVVEELLPVTEPYTRFRRDLLVMIIIASVVASTGLFANNAAVVIGAMLLAPLVGPITAFAFNATIGRPLKMKQVAISGFILLVAVVGAGAVVTGIASAFVDLQVTDEINLRTTTSPITIGVAILLGVAGGIAIISAIPGILVGVAIAAALVPPATVTGIGLALLDTRIFTGALLQTSSTTIGLLLGSMIIFFIRGISARRYYEKEKAKRYLIITISTFAGLSILLGILSFIR